MNYLLHFIYQNSCSIPRNACRLQKISMRDYQEKWDYRIDGWTDGQTDTRMDRRQTKWSLCAAMLRRRHKNLIHILHVHACLNLFYWLIIQIQPISMYNIHYVTSYPSITPYLFGISTLMVHVSISSPFSSVHTELSTYITTITPYLLGISTLMVQVSISSPFSSVHTASNHLWSSDRQYAQNNTMLRSCFSSRVDSFRIICLSFTGANTKGGL